MFSIPILDPFVSPKITTVFSYLLLPNKVPPKLLALTTTIYLFTIMLPALGSAGQFYVLYCLVVIPGAAFHGLIGWWIASTWKAFCLSRWPFNLVFPVRYWIFKMVTQSLQRAQKLLEAARASYVLGLEWHSFTCYVLLVTLSLGSAPIQEVGTPWSHENYKLWFISGYHCNGLPSHSLIQDFIVMASSYFLTVLSPNNEFLNTKV